MDKVPQMFRFTGDVVKSLDSDDVLATFYDMAELGIARAPYEDFCIKLEESFMLAFAQVEFKNDPELLKAEEEAHRTLFEYGSCMYIRYQYRFHDNPEMDEVRWLCGIQPHKGAPIDWIPTITMPTDIRESLDAIADGCIKRLIVLLATSNIEKTVVKNSLTASSHQVRQDAKNFEYTTTIRIGKITESCSGDSSGTGSKKRPHLRRGHIRHQRVGEKRAEVKKIFVAPTFINADDKWVANARKEYKFKAA